MSFKNFFENTRFNFVNFFAFTVFMICASIWLVIILLKSRVDNPHIAEIRTLTGNIVLLIIGFFFGASQSTKKKDETVDKVIESNIKKDEVIKTIASAKEE
jgi:hypothetical protein